MKKAIAIIIAAVMLCVMFTADSADAAVPHLYINGHAVTEDETNSEEGWSYDASTPTLTLNNATLDDGVYYHGGSYSTIYYDRYDTLNIILIGDSTIDVQVDAGDPGDGIYLQKSINISGNGSLTITNPSSFSSGIYSYDGDITIAGGDYTIDARMPICAENIGGHGGNITISGGTIHANNKIGGVDNVSFDMTGGYLEVSGLLGNELAVVSDSINLHGAETSNATINAVQISATAAGNVIISHLYDKTVTFNSNGGVDSPYSRHTNIEGRVFMSTPGKPGYVFRGWFTSPSGGDQKTIASRFTEDTELYAHWAPAICTVSLEANGGSCDTDYVEVANGETATLPVATREGYAFIGWFTSPSGGEQMTNDSHFYDDTILYAHWVRQYTVTFDANSGQCLVTSAVTGIDGKLDSLPDATCEGYAFIGWFTSPSGGEQVGPDNVYDSDRTVYAHWTSNPNPSPDERPSPDSPDSGDDKKANNGLLIGGIVGGIAAVAVIAGVVIFFIRKH